MLIDVYTNILVISIPTDYRQLDADVLCGWLTSLSHFEFRDHGSRGILPR